MTQSVTKPTKPREQLLRRQTLSSGAAALIGSMLVGRANAGEAQPMPSPTKESNGASATLLDQFAVSQVIARERYARETQDYDMEAACFHPEAFVDVSWFSGTAAEFVETGRKAAARGRAATSLVATYFDALSPPVVWINKDRAIADGSCAVHAFSSIGGVEVHVTSYTRLLWRAQRLQGEWPSKRWTRGKCWSLTRPRSRRSGRPTATSATSRSTVVAPFATTERAWTAPISLPPCAPLSGTG